MKLIIPERIALLGLLPTQSNVITLKVVMELQKELSFTEQEIKRFSLKNSVKPDGVVSISWNPNLANEAKDIKIGETARGIIVERLKTLDSQGKLHISMLPLYERFVEGKE